ncbi:MAG: hypothetical protein A4E56_00175 [Pelotomaculum sp. PtaU1.Bin065]|nr:MAG: hypothetical protein A4E56_00175 [Pelotomaculum sp. PtaU1.Bin065]
MRTIRTMAKIWLAGHLVDRGFSILLTLALLGLVGIGYYIVIAEIRKVFGL